MQFKIGQPMITIMNIANIIVQHTITIFKYSPPCRQMCAPHFCSTNYTTNVYNWSVFKRQCFSESVRLSLSHFCYGCTWNSKIARNINKKSAKLTRYSQYRSPTHTYTNCK